MPNSRKGRCLCGAVTIRIDETKTGVGACHCVMCRKWTGGAPLLAVHTDNVLRVEGEGNIAIFDSSAWAERGFCKNCGTHLFYHLKDGGDYIIAAGLFDNVDEFNLTEEIFVDQKPSFYDFLDPKSDKKTAADIMGNQKPDGEAPPGL